MHPYIGKLAHYKNRSKVRTAKVVGYETRAKGPDQVIVEAKGKAFKRLSVNDVLIEIPEQEIPIAWQEILNDNPWEDILCKGVKHTDVIGVCYDPYAREGATTLFHKQTLETLEYERTQPESGNVKLWNGHGTPSEGKPSITDGDVQYTVGDIEITMDAVPY